MSNSNLVLPALVQKEAAQPKAQVVGTPVLGLSIAEYTGLIKLWAQDRNLIEGSTFAKQSGKLFEEVGEMALHINKGADKEGGDVPDDIGDVTVVLTIMCAQAGVDVEKYIGVDQQNPNAANMDKNGLLTVLNMGLAAFAMAQFSENQTELQESVETSEKILCDIFIVLEEMASRYGTNLRGCLEISYNEIKDRKGRMIDGVFVKEADLPKPVLAD